MVIETSCYLPRHIQIGIDFAAYVLSVLQIVMQEFPIT